MPPNGPFLRIATSGRGVWEVNFNQIASQFSVAGVPANATAGTTISNVVVTALDAGNATVAGYAGTIHFTSTDGSASLPADYTFVASDHGVHTFANFTLRSSGSRTITATDTVTSITGTSAAI